jgi:hypothetical protein
VRATASIEFLVGQPTGAVQSSGLDIGLDSPIPLVSQELLETPRESI